MDDQMKDRLSQAGESGKPLQEKDLLWALLEKATLAEAGNLARQGRYAEAETILGNAVREREATPAILDLLARIHAQQGHWKEAEAAWKEALQRDPGGGSYSAGLNRIARMQKQPRFLRIFILALVVLLIVVGFLAGGRYFLGLRSPAVNVSPVSSWTPSQPFTPTFTLTQTPSVLPTLASTPTSLPSPTQDLTSLPAAGTCTAELWTNVRSAPGIDNPVIGLLSQGEQVVVLGSHDLPGQYRWLLIFREPDLVGWIFSDYCKKPPDLR